jgi:hypothetical protein
VQTWFVVVIETLASQSLIFFQLFMAAVGLVFAPLAPLVAVAAAVVFWISSVVYKYQLMFVFVTKVESGGVCSDSCLLASPVAHSDIR